VGVAVISEDGETGAIDEALPPEAEGKRYFLEVSTAREILEGWESHLPDQPPLSDCVERIVYYARFDA
jgi:hypothetical protein